MEPHVHFEPQVHEEPQPGSYSLRHVLAGYLLAVAIASVPLAVLLAAVFGVDIPVEAGRGHITDREASLMEVSALLVGAFIAFVVTFLLAAAPFAGMLLVAKRYQIQGWSFYVSMWSASAAAMLGTYAILFAIFVHPHHPMPPTLWTGLVAASIALTVFWGLGGLAYWGYARRRQPMLAWRAAARSAGPSSVST